MNSSQKARYKYYSKNKDKLIKMSFDYYYQNYMSEPIKCPLCFTITSRGHLNRYKKTMIGKRIQSIILDCDAYTTS